MSAPMKHDGDGHFSVDYSVGYQNDRPSPSSQATRAQEDYSSPPHNNRERSSGRNTRKRTKTGCVTCRKRRIKCDESKPACQRCTKSRRTCEGYSSKAIFRNEGQAYFAPPSIRPQQGISRINEADKEDEDDIKMQPDVTPRRDYDQFGTVGPGVGQETGNGAVSGGLSTRSDSLRSDMSEPITGNGYLPPYGVVHGHTPNYNQTSLQPPYIASLNGAVSYPSMDTNSGTLQAQVCTDSRNSSLSTASGASPQSGTTERRISVMSLVSGQNPQISPFGPMIGNGTNSFVDVSTYNQLKSFPPSSGSIGKLYLKSGNDRQHEEKLCDARSEQHYYNYFTSNLCHVLAKTNPSSARCLRFWSHTIPELLQCEASEQRGLFGAVVAYTASFRTVQLPIDYNIYTTGQAALVEIGLKSYLDIIRNGTYTLKAVEQFFDPNIENEIHTLFRWGILRHTVFSILSDGQPRARWVAYLLSRSTVPGLYEPGTDIEAFYLQSLGYYGTQMRGLPQSIKSMSRRFDYTTVPGVDLIYYAMVEDYTSLRSACYRVLSHARLESVYVALRMIEGARCRGVGGLESLMGDLADSLSQLV